MQNVRIYEIPDCKMVSSGVGMFGDGTLEKFDEWLSMQPRGIYPKDFCIGTVQMKKIRASAGSAYTKKE